MQPETSSPSKSTAPRGIRFLLYFAAIILTFLLLWLWSFILSDISIVNHPHYDEIESSIVDPALETRLTELRGQSNMVTRKISDLEQSQRLLRDSTNSTRDTMNQLLENQKALADKNITLSPAEQEAIAQSQRLFLDNQTKYQELNQEVVELTAEKRRLTDEMAAVETQLEPAKRQAHNEYRNLYEKAEMRSAVIQLSLLMPLFLIASWLTLKKRKSTYGVLIYPFGISLFLKMMSVVHTYFPSRYFKYIALLGLIFAVVALIIYLVRMMVRPDKDTVLKRNREAYSNQTCPTCTFPIQQNLLNRLGLNRKRAPRLIDIPATETPGELKPYSCPSCGEKLYEKCEHCANVRHSLLPYCEHCGGQKSNAQAHDTNEIPDGNPA